MDIHRLHRRVLVSDSESGVCSKLIRALEHRRIQVEADLEGDAHGRAKASRPALIILDLAQSAGGKSQLLRLRQDPDTADIPVVVVGAAGSGAPWEECIRLGAVDFTDRPFDERFAERIARLLVGLHLVPGPGTSVH